MIERKMPPQALELEKSIIGAMMMEQEVTEEVLQIINNEDIFYSFSNQIIFKVIKDLYNDQKNIDIHTITEGLKKNESLEKVGGIYELMKLMDDVSTSANVKEHCHILLEKYMKREIIRTSQESISDGFNDKIDVFDLIAKQSNNLERLNSTIIKGRIEDVSNELNNLTERMIYLFENKIEVSGITSGYKELDKVTGGFQNTDLIIIGARPAVGKSAFILNIINECLNNNKSCAVFSLEMSTKQILQRLLSLRLSISLESIVRNSLSQSELEIIVKESEQLKIKELYIDDLAGLSIEQLKLKLRQVKRKKNVDIAFVDYLQLMTVEGVNNTTNREQEISRISRGLKGIAKELDIPVVALCQLNRVKDEYEKPTLSNLRESGAIEQDADIVSFLYRGEGNERKFSIAKHRNGRLENYDILFQGEHQKFYDMKISGMMKELTRPF